jgi:MFS family permease
VASWALAMALSAAAPNFLFLLGARLLLGLTAAVAGPAVASLLGDFFPEPERGRIFGYVLAGELVGTGFGFVVAGDLAKVGWRVTFFALAPFAIGVAWLVGRLPEPARGGPSRMPQGARRIRSAAALAAGEVRPYLIPSDESSPTPGASTDAVGEEIRRRGIPPEEDLILREDPGAMPLRAATRYVLRIRSNVVLIVASALGYFFLTGIRGFAVEFVKGQYGLGQVVASLLIPVLGVGALVGVLLGGRVADWWLRRGQLSSRVLVPGVAVLVAAVLFVPPLLTSSLAVALPLLCLAAGFLGASNPPLDAARLDIMHPRLWGRAEAVRTVLRGAAEGVAPVLFGFLAQDVFGGRHGLRDAFLLMLVPLVAASLLALLVGRRTYPRDVANAAASERAVRR